jgi:ribosomal protein S18 acetylase RimI-like enzyme
MCFRARELVPFADMVTVQAIDERSPLLESVKQPWRAHSETLGFMPEGAFADYARERHVLVALNGNECVGYLLYRIVRDRVTIAHFCVAEGARRNGVARLILDNLIRETTQCQGIVLSCRRDFEASKAWPRLGFHAAGEIVGRAKEGSTLVRWVLDYGHADMFSQAGESTVLDAAVDLNICVDLVECRNDETRALESDWLQPLVRLCCAPEMLNEINRIDDVAIRAKRKRDAQRFEMLRYGHDAFRKAEETLTPLFPQPATTQSESDYRHLVGALAGEADVFVTRDGALLELAEQVYSVCGLRIVRPAELVGLFDILIREREYQRSFIAGTRRIIQQRINHVERDLVTAIQATGEQQRNLASSINKHLADPQHVACTKVSEADGSTLAFYVVEIKSDIHYVRMLRICGTRRAGSLARAILTGLVRQVVKAGGKAVLVTEGSLSTTVREACAALGFIPVADGWLKLVLFGWVPIDEIPSRIAWNDPKVIEFLGFLAQARTDRVTASYVEHVLWPAKFADTPLPCFMVPIRPHFAEHLFDVDLAVGSLFGADVDLALNPESAYYRAVKPSIVKSPSRVLWYVSQKANYVGSKAIRACSRVIEVAIDKPKTVYSRFKRLGVYEWKDVLKTASGNLDQDIMAFRFDDTELLRPVPWSTFQQILKSNGITSTLQSPVEIPASVFGEIYAAGFNSS